MSDEQPKTKIEQLEEKLEARRAERAKAEGAQLELDLEARIELEDEHGTIASVKVSRFVPGQPTQAYLKTPTGAQYQRYKAQIHSAVSRKNLKDQQEAGELLAKSCWVYPKTVEARDSMLAVFPGLLTSLGMTASALAEGRSEDEGKG